MANGRQLAWRIEQRGKAVAAQDHYAHLHREPFTLVIGVRGSQSFSLFVNAAFSPRTLDAARKGRTFEEMEGFNPASRIDSMMGWSNNQQRDIWVASHGSSLWVSCMPGDPACNGFDSPCKQAPHALFCERTIKRFFVPPPGVEERWQPIEDSREPTLFVVFFLSDEWNDSHLEGRVAWPERDRDWVTIRWTP